MPLLRRATAVILRWWPVPTFIAGALLAQDRLLTSRYDVGGHAAEHLSGASAPYMAVAVSGLLLWSTPAARRTLDLLAIVALWFATTVLVMIGNLRVVDDLVAAGHARTPTGAVPDVADHSLANSSVWYAEVAALLLVLAWRHRGHLGNRSAVGAIVVTLLIPPWIIPGAGPILVLVVRLAARRRIVERPDTATSPGPGYGAAAPS